MTAIVTAHPSLAWEPWLEQRVARAAANRDRGPGFDLSSLQLFFSTWVGTRETENLPI